MKKILNYLLTIRFRYWFMSGGTALVLASLFATDPDGGAVTGIFILTLVTPVIAVAFSHISRRALFDYPSADMSALFEKAKESPIGAGLALIALALVISALLGLFGRAANAHTVHPRAVALAPVLKNEIITQWPAIPIRAYVPALISHESCISYKHSRCWSHTSQLKTAREEGAGLGQITRAWNADGTLRFDTLVDMRNKHPALRELSWVTIYRRPDLQIRALILMSRDNYTALGQVSDMMERLAFADAAYNGGLGGVQKERRACALAKGCDPQRWWNNVELHCMKSKKVLYGTRSACDINRHHVHDVLHTRTAWYASLI